MFNVPKWWRASSHFKIKTWNRIGYNQLITYLLFLVWTNRQRSVLQQSCETQPGVYDDRFWRSEYRSFRKHHSLTTRSVHFGWSSWKTTIPEYKAWPMMTFVISFKAICHDRTAVPKTIVPRNRYIICKYKLFDRFGVLVGNCSVVVTYWFDLVTF